MKHTVSHQNLTEFSVARNILSLMALLATVVPVPVCLANNNLFLPGDAFFPTVLTKADVEALQEAKTGERTFRYSSFGGYEGAFCGYAGYANAIIPSVDDRFAKNLELVYQRIRRYQRRELAEWVEDGKTELVETNGMRVLFYPPGFQFPRHALGLRYNENWVEECLKFGHEREHLRLCCLISDPEAVARSWRDADIVPALSVELPETSLAPVPVTETPVLVKGPVRAIALGAHSLQKLLQPDYDDYLTIYVVDSNGVAALEHGDGKWQRSEQE
jgi:hypothetical protein